LTSIVLKTPLVNRTRIADTTESEGVMSRPLALLAMICLVANEVFAATFFVTKTADDPVGACDADCSLREAVIAANQSPGHDTIIVPAGIYVLSLVGAGEDEAATGDLDLNDDVEIVGDPDGGTVIDGLSSDRMIHLDGFTVTLVDLVLTNGRTIGDFFGAGGILVESGTLTMTRCVLSSCSCDGHGGGLFSLGLVTIDRSAVVHNTGANGGGIYHAGVDLVLMNSTVSGNTATTAGSGGLTTDGLALTANVTSSTFSNNSGAESEAAVIRCNINVTNTIFDGTCAVVPGMGTVSSNGGNLESPGDTCGLDHLTDQTSINPVDLALETLQNNGGTTPTHALDSGSVAVDSANNTLCPTVDQRDWQRLDGSCDVGSFELGAAEPPIFADGFESGTTGAWS
jgi:CSLREA domain-containing protein